MLKAEVEVEDCHTFTLMYISFSDSKRRKRVCQPIKSRTPSLDPEFLVPLPFPQLPRVVSCAMLRCMIVSSSKDYVAICCAALRLCRVLSCSAATRCAVTHHPSPSTGKKTETNKLCFTPSIPSLFRKEQIRKVFEKIDTLILGSSILALLLYLSPRIQLHL